jgi:hypothetical protein
MFEELSTVALTQGTRNLVRAMELVTDPGIVDRTVASLGIIAANHIPMRAWIGKYDPVAPFDELQATLPANLHDLLVRVPAAHVAMGTPEGFAQAQIVADFLAPSFPTSYYRL